MPKIPSKMHMYDMVKIETIVFEIVGENLKHPDGIGLSTTTNTLRKHIINYAARIFLFFHKNSNFEIYLRQNLFKIYKYVNAQNCTN